MSRGASSPARPGHLDLRPRRRRTPPLTSGSGGEVPAGQALSVGLEQPVHLPHRVLGRPSVVGCAQVLEEGLLRLARLRLLNRLLYRVVHATALWAGTAMQC